MKRFSILMLFLLLLCGSTMAGTPSKGTKSVPPMPPASDETVARITGENFIFAIKDENAAGCTLDFCSEFKTSEFGPGVTIPPEGQILFDLGKDGNVGFLIFKYKGEEITEIHAFENSHRAELKPNFNPAITAGQYFSPCQFVYHNNRYTIWWEAIKKEIQEKTAIIAVKVIKLVESKEIRIPNATVSIRMTTAEPGHAVTQADLAAQTKKTENGYVEFKDMPRGTYVIDVTLPDGTTMNSAFNATFPVNVMDVCMNCR